MHAEYVWYNDGAGSRYALVSKKHSETMYDLLVLTESGVSVRTSVPHREPSDYGPEGGGHTWHE